MNLKRNIPVLTILFAVAWTTGFAQSDRIEVTTDGVGVSLILPAGLKPFSDEKMALVRQKGIAAKFIFSDAPAEVMVVINTFGSEASQKALPMVAKQIETDARKLNQSVEVLRNDFIKINGRKWLRFSIREGTGRDAMIDNYFVTDWVGRYVLLDFTATAMKSDAYRNQFDQSAQTAMLSMIVRTKN